MAREIILREVDGALTATLPQDMADRLHVGPGDKLYVVETDGGILLTLHDPSFDAGMEAFERVRRQYDDTLRRLAE
jgi:putative addiction module antidote